MNDGTTIDEEFSVELCGLNGCIKPINEAGYHRDGLATPNIPEEGTPEESPVEDNWEVEITVLAKNANQITQVSNIKSENKITVKNIVTDSELLNILNYIQPKP